MSLTNFNLNIFIHTLKNDLLERIMKINLNHFTNNYEINFDNNKIKKINIFLNIASRIPQSIPHLNINDFLDNYTSYLNVINEFLKNEINNFDIYQTNINNDKEFSENYKKQLIFNLKTRMADNVEIRSKIYSILKNYEFIQLCINSKNIVNEISETLSTDDIHLYFIKISTEYLKYIKNPSDEIYSIISSMIDNKDNNDINNSSYEKLITIPKGTVLRPSNSIYE